GGVFRGHSRARRASSCERAMAVLLGFALSGVPLRLLRRGAPEIMESSQGTLVLRTELFAVRASWIGQPLGRARRAVVSGAPDALVGAGRQNEFCGQTPRTPAQGFAAALS